MTERDSIRLLPISAVLLVTSLAGADEVPLARLSGGAGLAAARCDGACESPKTETPSLGILATALFPLANSAGLGLTAQHARFPFRLSRASAHTFVGPILELSSDYTADQSLAFWLGVGYGVSEKRTQCNRPKGLSGQVGLRGRMLVSGPTWLGASVSYVGTNTLGSCDDALELPVRDTHLQDVVATALVALEVGFDVAQ